MEIIEEDRKASRSVLRIGYLSRKDGCDTTDELVLPENVERAVCCLIDRKSAHVYFGWPKDIAAPDRGAIEAGIVLANWIQAEVLNHGSGMNWVKSKDNSWELKASGAVCKLSQLQVSGRWQCDVRNEFAVSALPLMATLKEVKKNAELHLLRLMHSP